MEKTANNHEDKVKNADIHKYLQEYGIDIRRGDDRLKLPPDVKGGKGGKIKI